MYRNMQWYTADWYVFTLLVHGRPVGQIRVLTALFLRGVFQEATDCPATDLLFCVSQTPEP